MSYKNAAGVTVDGPPAIAPQYRATTMKGTDMTTHYVDENATPGQHRIMVRAHSMDRHRLVVVCACGELYEDPAYVEKEGSADAVPLSVLMDIAERHMHEHDVDNGRV